MLFKTALRKASELGLALTAITALLLAGCGGGSSSSTPPPTASTLGGVAAVGYPIVGATVQVVCAGGSALNTTTSGTGTWQVTFSGQTAPCAAQVSGGTINGATNTTNYHSISTTTGTLNASPLTDLVVANLVGTSTPSTWFTGITATPTLLNSITLAGINASVANLAAALPQLPLGANNPLNMTFSATPGTVGDDMLAALQTAMTNSTTAYATLLGYASAPGFTAPAAGFSTALTTAYAGTASGGSITPPATPTGVGATASSTSQINIAWTNVSGATSYNVYRSTSASVQIIAGNIITSGTSTTSSPFANSGLAASTQYFYKVTAVNAAGESGGSTEVSATTQAVVATPTITSFTPGSGAAGSTVTITGTNLTAVTEVLFTDPSTAFTSAAITTHTATSIAATVPASLAAGSYIISVLYPGNELAAAGTFTVTAASVNTPFASIISSFNSAQCQPGASATSYGHCGAAVVMDFNVTVGIYVPCTVTKVGGLLSITQGATTHSATLDGTPADLISFPGANSMSLQASDPTLGNYVNFDIISGVLHASDAYSSWTPLSCY